MPAFKLGDRADKESTENLTEAAPPVVLRVQPDSFIRLEAPEELRSWEEAVRMTAGVKVSAENLVGSASESCSAGCTDDCDIC